jgi:3-dehydroquinate dehydratase-2
VQHIQNSAAQNTCFIVINAAALTHTSIALRDALSSVGIPFIEIHLSNIYRRESFRQKSFLSDIATGVICGFGAEGYYMALKVAIKRLRS